MLIGIWVVRAMPLMQALGLPLDNILLQSIVNLNSLHKLWISPYQLTTLLSSLNGLLSNCDINVSYNYLLEEYHFSCFGEVGHPSVILVQVISAL